MKLISIEMCTYLDLKNSGIQFKGWLSFSSFTNVLSFDSQASGVQIHRKSKNFYEFVHHTLHIPWGAKQK